MKVGVIYETVAVMFIDDNQSGQPATYCLNPQLTGAITNDIVVIANKFRRADDSGCDLLSVPHDRISLCMWGALWRSEM